MKRIALFVGLLLSFTAMQAQTWTKVNGRWQYQFLRSDSTFTPPQDTLFSAPIGSVAVKNDVVYFKNAGGLWVSLVGLSINLATAPLTANGNYLHNWNHKQLFIDSFSTMRFNSYETETAQGTRKLTNVLLTGNNWFSTTFYVASALRKFNNSVDSVSVQLQLAGGGATLGRTDFAINLQNKFTAAGTHAEHTSTNFTKTSQFLTSLTMAQILGNDSVLIKGVAAAGTGDTVLTLIPSTNGYFKLGRKAIGGLAANIANSALTADGDYAQNWNHKILRIDTIKSLTLTGTENDPFLSRQVSYLNTYTPSFLTSPMRIKVSLRSAANDADSITNEILSQSGGQFNMMAYTATKTSGVLMTPNILSLRGADSAEILSPRINFYNTTGDIKFGTGAGVTPYATWKNAGRLLMGTTTDDGFGKLQINAVLGDFQAAQTINVSGSTAFDAPHGLVVNETSTDGGYGIRSNSTNGTAVLGLGRETGVAGSVQATAEGLTGAAGVIGTTIFNTTAPAIIGKAYGTNAAPNQILSGLDLWRIPTAFPTSGGIMMRTFLPVYINAIGAVQGTPILANTITSATTNYVGVNYTTDMYFSGPKDSVYGRILTLKGGGQIQGDQYTGSNFETVDTSMPAAVFGTDGKIYRRRGDAGGGGATITASNGLTKTVNDIAPGGTVSSPFTWALATSSDRINVTGTSNGAFGNINVTDNGAGAGVLSVQNNNSGDAIIGFHAGTGAGLVGLSSSGPGVAAQSIGGGPGLDASSGTGIPVRTLSNQAGTTNSQTAVHIIRTNPPAGGTPGVGFGSDIMFSHEDATESTAVDAGKVTSYWTNSTTKQSNLDFWTVSGATFSSKLSIKHNGSTSFGGNDYMTWDEPTQYLTVTSAGGEDDGGVHVVNGGDDTYQLAYGWTAGSTSSVHSPYLNLANNLGKQLQIYITGNTGQGNIGASDSLRITAQKRVDVESERINIYASDSLRIKVPAQASADSILAVTNWQSAGGGLVTNKVVKIPYTPVPVKVKFVQTATVSVIANDVETTMIGTGTGSLTIPANSMAVGKHYRLTVRGTYGTDATNPAQQNWRLYLGGTVILSSGNAGLGTNRVDKIFTIGADITCRTTGGSGTVMAVGMFNTEDGPGAKGFAPATTTIDTTTGLTFNFTTDLNDGSAGNNFKVYELIFEEI